MSAVVLSKQRPVFRDVGSGSNPDASIAEILRAESIGTGANSVLSAAVIVAALGSGGMLIPRQLKQERTTGGFSIEQQAATRSKTPTRILTATEKLVRIKSRFGLNISQLAEILRVGRPTVYQWLRGGAMRLANQERTEQIYEFSEDWVQLTQLPVGKLVTSQLADGRTLLELLSDEEISRVAILQAFRSIAPAVIENQESAKVQSLSERLRRRGFSHPPARMQETQKDAGFPSVSGPED